MGISGKIKTVFRGDVPLHHLPLEMLRRKRQAARRRVERSRLDEINATPARLSPAFASVTPDGLLGHFRKRTVSFLAVGDAPDALERTPKLQRELFPADTDLLIGAAERIVRDSTWELAGFGDLKFGGKNAWRRDPLGEYDWGTDYHADVVVFRPGGPDIRVLWELNRLGHVITLARAFATTADEVYAVTFFSHVESWMMQNPYGCGANWNCAMEVALRAINLLAAFDIFRRSKACTSDALLRFLQLLDQHGRFIRENDEFSYIATSNHYLSDVVGLFWIGTLLPELDNAADWRDFGLREMLREMDKQILPDGADFEASGGYHKFVTEMLLYSFILAKRTDISLPRDKWEALRRMLMFLKGISRPDGSMPLIGDADGSQIVPIVQHDAAGSQYLMAVGSVVFDEPALMHGNAHMPEVLWILGPAGVDTAVESETGAALPASIGFPDAGAYIMRDGDLYLYLNANDCGVNGRGSHGHNDALSIDVSAFGHEFIIDPGSFVYNLDRDARQLFRSTAYHSTVMVDDLDQNTTAAELPFVIGNEARPAVLSWKTGPELDRLVAQHDGYMRLADPVSHRRTVEFHKADRYWIIDDVLAGEREHRFTFSFHIAPGVAISGVGDTVVQIDRGPVGSLLLAAGGGLGVPEIESASRSLSYGDRHDSHIVRWSKICVAPLTVRFVLMPVADDKTLDARLALAMRLTQNIGN